MGRRAGVRRRYPRTERPVISVPVGDTDIVLPRVASLVSAGYSLRSDLAGAAILAPEPSGILYLAEWMTTSGTEKGSLDWFRQISGAQFRRFLVTTAPGNDRTFAECADLADEAWCLSKLIDREAVPNS